MVQISEQAIPTSPGVYGIVCIPTGMVLVGSSKNLRDRWARHQTALRGGYHDNPYLQRSWGTRGKDSFAFRVLEECSENALLATEDHWMAVLNSTEHTWCGYNMQGAVKPLMSEEIIRRRAESARGRVVSEETRRKIGLANSIPGRTAKAIQASADARRGKPGNPRAIRAMHEAMRKLRAAIGGSMSAQQRGRISKALMGHAVSAATIKKMIETKRRRAAERRGAVAA